MKLPRFSKKIFKWIPAYILPLFAVVFAWNYFMIPSNMTFIEGHNYSCNTILPVSLSVSSDGNYQMHHSGAGENCAVIIHSL